MQCFHSYPYWFTCWIISSELALVRLLYVSSAKIEVTSLLLLYLLIVAFVVVDHYLLSSFCDNP